MQAGEALSAQLYCTHQLCGKGSCSRTEGGMEVMVPGSVHTQSGSSQESLYSDEASFDDGKELCF